ncbi:hypothetical protein CoNPh26_CDS0035 [Staphylococcus phage S-CoN_Ph26]|nr:hypothetical protein CoNPh26_CDS0035 [Staphylococcus phage S-CoN_Ph26]
MLPFNSTPILSSISTPTTSASDKNMSLSSWYNLL